MKLLTVTLNRKNKTAPEHINRVSTPKIELKTVGFVNVKTGRTYKTKDALRVSIAKYELTAKLRTAKAYSDAFKASIVLAGKELMIKAKKALLKYGYSFAKTVEVAKAYLSLRNFRNSLSYSVRNLLVNR